VGVVYSKYMTFVSDSIELAELCARLAKEPYVAIDTEFMRDKTYYSKLCLVQLAGATDVAAVDPLADGIDLTPLYDLLANPDVLKVFHAARQDIEIFVHRMGTVPSPVFDTQIAGMVCGFGDAISYDRMVRALTGVKLDKTSRFTDWSHRPLSEHQLTYALADVIHLRPSYEALRDRLAKTDRSSWLDEEMATLTATSTYLTAPEDSWKRLKVRSTKPKFLVVLQALAAWRELEAQERDVPRNRVIRDDALVDIAAQAPTTTAELARSRAFNSDNAGGKTGSTILAAVKQALDSPKESWPKVEEKQEMPAGKQPVIDLLKVLLRLNCEDHDVAPKLVANADDLEAIAIDDNADVPALRGWRRKVFGEDALAVKAGRIAFAYDAKAEKIELVELDD
jgi:ribonuclease D